MMEKLDRFVQPAVEPVTRRQRQWKRINAATAPLADPDRIKEMLLGLDRLPDQRIDVRFSSFTGLVRSLRGNLYPEKPAKDADEKLKIAESFLRQHGDALFGYTGYLWDLTEQMSIGSVVRVQQVNRDGIPLYGGTCVFNFSGHGWLSMIMSSWYPIPPDDGGEQRPFDVTWEDACDVAKYWVHQYLLRAGTETSGQQAQFDPDAMPDLVCRPGDDLAEGKILVPWREGAGEMPYARALVPAWTVLVRAPSRPGSWEVIVDARTGEVLQAQVATVHAPLWGCVYKDNANAIAKNPMTVELASSGDLGDAPYFALQGVAFAGPSACTGTEQEASDAMRGANVYYHLCHARAQFSAIGAKAWAGDADCTVEMPGSPSRVDVTMYGQGITADYDSDGKSIFFGRGQAQSMIRDPACDCEVIYHEYTHAVLQTVQPDIFKDLPYDFRHAINEGVAFYYGCTLSERPCEGLLPPGGNPSRWGDYAYQDPATWKTFRELQRENPAEQRPNFDYLAVCGAFPKYSGQAVDPDGPHYACAMVWARALWDVRRVLEIYGTDSLGNRGWGPELADAVILRSLAMLGGVHSDLETPAEAIIQADAEVAKIYKMPSHESALRLIFCSRGIAANTPIHDLLEVKLGTHSYVLAAVENPSQDNGPPGCMISDDAGTCWAPLGKNGPPAQVVALAAVEEDDAKAVIWAAGECWTGSGNTRTLSGKVYRYDLTLDSAGRIETGGAWAEVDMTGVPTSLGILSLAAMKKPGGAAGEYLVFAGTEDGLYKHDNGWSLVIGKLISDLAVADLPVAGQPQPQTRLLVATNERIWILNPTSGEYDMRPFANDVLTVTAQVGSGEVWAGTALEGIHHYDPGQGWQSDASIGRPVYCLWVDQEAGQPPDLYAGTNDGVYWFDGAGWQPFNTPVQPNAECIDATSVVCLVRIGDRLLAGTAQRGLWVRDPVQGWRRLGQGLSRAGRWVDAQVPANTSSWSLPTPFGGPLEDHGVGTHVLHVPSGNFSTLSLDVTGNVRLGLYYSAPIIDLDAGYGAGLQGRVLQGGVMTGQVKEGYYLLAVAAEKATQYQIGVNLD